MTKRIWLFSGISMLIIAALWIFLVGVGIGAWGNWPYIIGVIFIVFGVFNIIYDIFVVRKKEQNGELLQD